MGFDEIPDRSDHHVAEGHIGNIRYFLKDILLIRRDPHRHNSIAFFRHTRKVSHLTALTIKTSELLNRQTLDTQ